MIFLLTNDLLLTLIAVLLGLLFVIAEDNLIGVTRNRQQLILWL